MRATMLAQFRESELLGQQHIKFKKIGWLLLLADLLYDLALFHLERWPRG